MTAKLAMVFLLAGVAQTYPYDSPLGSGAADSDDVAQAFRDDAAHHNDMMSPGCDASLADDFCHWIL